MPEPGDQNQTGPDKKKDDKDAADKENAKDQDKDKKSIKSKLHDALQQWSNDDARDIAEDDASPLRSGL